MKSSHIRIMKDPKERKQEILEAALNLFSQKGYDKTTIQDIAQKLNISQGLCYRYFKSKNELFLATAEFYAQQVMEKITAPFPQDMKAIDKLNIVVKRIFEYIIRHSRFECSSKVCEIRGDRLSSIVKQMIEVFVPIVEQGNREGIFACKNVEVISKVVIYGLTYSFHEDLLTIDSKDMDVYIKNYLKSLRLMLIDILKIKESEKLGTTWQNI